MQKTQQYLTNETHVLAELTTFIALADTLSFLKAAERLRRDATVVSRRLKALESRLGVRLLNRNTRSVALTEAGEIYADRVRGILQMLNEADNEISQFVEGEPQGNLRLSLPESFGKLWVAPLISEFLRDYPLITVEAEYSNRYVDLIGERFDLAVRLGDMADSRLVARRVGDRFRALYASPDYLMEKGKPRNPVDLEHHSCLVWMRNSARNRWELEDKDGHRERVSVNGALSSNDAEVLVRGAINGHGIVMAADWLAGPWLQSGQLVRVLPEWRSANIGGIFIVTPGKNGLKSKTRFFSDWLAKRLGYRPWSV